MRKRLTAMLNKSYLHCYIYFQDDGAFILKTLLALFASLHLFTRSYLYKTYLQVTSIDQMYP